MTDADDTTSLKDQLAAHRRTLAVYLRQLASLGADHAPPGVHNGIAEARSEIARLKAALRDRGVVIQDQADDEDRSSRRDPAPVPLSTRVVVLLEGDIQQFTPKQQEGFVFVLARIIDVRPDQIRIVHIGSGNIKLTLNMPQEAARRLVALYATADPSLAQLPLRPLNIIIQPRKSIIGIIAVSIALLIVGVSVATTLVVIPPFAPSSTGIAGGSASTSPEPSAPSILSGTPSPLTPTPPSPRPTNQVARATAIPCLFQSSSDEQTIKNIINAEATAANNKNRELINAIFASDAIIINAVNDQRWNIPAERYDPFFDGATITDAKHTDVRNLGIQEAVAYFTSAGSGVVNGTGYDNPPGSEHWTFRKNAVGCWVITEFDFNAGRLPFPPASELPTGTP